MGCAKQRCTACLGVRHWGLCKTMGFSYLYAPLLFLPPDSDSFLQYSRSSNDPTQQYKLVLLSLLGVLILFLAQRTWLPFWYFDLIFLPARLAWHDMHGFAFAPLFLLFFYDCVLFWKEDCSATTLLAMMRISKAMDMRLNFASQGRMEDLLPSFEIVWNLSAVLICPVIPYTHCCVTTFTQAISTSPLDQTPGIWYEIRPIWPAFSPSAYSPQVRFNVPFVSLLRNPFLIQNIARFYNTREKTPTLTAKEKQWLTN